MNTIKFILVLSMVLLASDLIANKLVYGQGQEVNETTPRTLMSCYGSFISYIDLINAQLPVNIDITDLDIKQYFANVCYDIHHKYGIWFNLLNESDTIKYKVSSSEFLSKYYPNGLPDSVTQMFQQLAKIQEGIK